MPTVRDWINHYRDDCTPTMRQEFMKALEILLVDDMITRYYRGDFTSLVYAIKEAESEVSHGRS